MKKKIIITTVFILFAVLLICVLPLPTRFTIVMDYSEDIAGEQILVENGILLSGKTYNYLFRQDTIQFDKIKIADLEIPEQNFAVIPMLNNDAEAYILISTLIYLSKENCHYPLLILMAEDWTSCTIEIQDRIFTCSLTK